RLVRPGGRRSGQTLPRRAEVHARRGRAAQNGQGQTVRGGGGAQTGGSGGSPAEQHGSVGQVAGQRRGVQGDENLRPARRGSQPGPQDGDGSPGQAARFGGNPPQECIVEKTGGRGPGGQVGASQSGCQRPAKCRGGLQVGQRP